jgi:hypothetical protein
MTASARRDTNSQVANGSDRADRQPQSRGMSPDAIENPTNLTRIGP